MAQTSAHSLTTSLDKLKISQSGRNSSNGNQSVPVDSWEDEAEEDDSDDTLEGSGTATPVRPVSSSDLPGAPPPTPSSPSFSSGKTSQEWPYQTFPPYGMESTSMASNGSSDKSTSRVSGGDDRRPDKSTAVASRLIAAGIGQRAPKRTKEQREYDQAMKVQEKKKRDQAKVEEEQRKKDVERAKQAVWDD